MYHSLPRTILSQPLMFEMLRSQQPPRQTRLAGRREVMDWEGTAAGGAPDVRLGGMSPALASAEVVVLGQAAVAVVQVRQQVRQQTLWQSPV